jgi:seryl-tRNA synthetase
MATKKENKKSKNFVTDPVSLKGKKTIAERVQLRLSQLDKKSANISKQIASIQKQIDNNTKLKAKVEALKTKLAAVAKEKEAEVSEICVMCAIYSKPKQQQSTMTPEATAPVITA